MTTDNRLKRERGILLNVCTVWFLWR